MLLRSASTPILKSWIPAAATAKEAPHVVSTDSFVPKNPRVRSNNSLSSSCCSPAASYSATSNGTKKMTRATSDNNLSDCLIPSPSPPLPKHKPRPRGMVPPPFSISLEEETKIDAAAVKNLSSDLSLMDEDCSRVHATALVVDDEGCLGDGNCNIHGNGGNICGSGGKGSSDSNSNDNSIDAYYQKMIEANPANSLVLSNYAKFLKEVRGDVARAQEYCERAILADQRDGDALSMYGEIIWEQSKDAQRAETYFDRAIQAKPDDCYVMASYAQFLWDAEEEEEEENQVKNDVMESVNRTTPSLFPGAAPPAVAAAS